MLHSQKKITFRFGSQPPADLPLTVRSCGSYTLLPGSQPEPPAQKWFSEIFWSEQGCGEFALQDKWLRLEGPCLFFLLPGEVHHIRPLSEQWTYHWLTLDHPASAQWLKAFGLSERPLPMRGCPRALFARLYRSLQQGTAEADRQAAHHAHAILLAALELRKSTSAHTPQPWVEECRRLMDKGYTDPELNISALAEELGIHRATLFRAFSQRYRMTPSHYLQSRRLHQAMTLLQQTDLLIKAISPAVGFADANYFARLLKKVSGFNPQQFRQMYRQQDSRS